jgi:hypothetical protein
VLGGGVAVPEPSPVDGVPVGAVADGSEFTGGAAVPGSGCEVEPLVGSLVLVPGSVVPVVPDAELPSVGVAEPVELDPGADPVLVPGSSPLLPV